MAGLVGYLLEATFLVLEEGEGDLFFDYWHQE